MSDTYNLIIIKAAQIKDSPEVIRNALGFNRSVHSYSAKFLRCGFDLWVAQVGNCLVIDCMRAWELASTVNNEERLSAEGQQFLERIAAAFPDSEIAALYYDSRTGHYGYSVFKSGKLVRCNSGEPGQQATNYGPKLAFEEHYLSSTYQSTERGGRTFYTLTRSENGDELPEAEVGSELADELFRDFVGSEMNSAEMSNVIGAGFLGSPLSCDPQVLIADPKPLVRSQSSMMLPVVVGLAMLFLILAALIAT
jgi:hypothetical protein